jgi:hypothetical protein
VIRDENSKLIFDSRQEYAPGNFCEELPNNLLAQAGDYAISVFEARDRIAGVSLEVSD